MMDKIVWCNGTFDILHPGHMQLFKVARSLGDKVIVATDTDEKIKKDKGEHRPVNDLCYRVAMLEAIKYIDVVLTFGDRQELEGLIQLYTPDILLLGDDWQGGDVVGIEHAKGVRFLPRVGGYASSKTLNKMKNL
jgi:rfaE bifunctional protein nucleotidyltransferase chain/domain|tara:strand:- start:30 stop:434 length:405 start_codon:yes stop_codon:yes gene_type:complete